MMNRRAWLAVLLASSFILMLACKARAANDPQPDKVRWEINCKQVRHAVAVLGEAGAEAVARQSGVPEHIIQRAKACLRK